MTALEEILKARLGAKEKLNQLAEYLRGNKKAAAEMIAYCADASAVNKAHCIEAVEYITKEEPAFAKPCLDFIIEQLGDHAPRVKMESGRVIANIAKTFPEHAAEAIPALLINTKDEGTVVKWAAAQALTEIAKRNPQTRKQLIPLFTKIAEQEENGGVKNTYLKALKSLQKK